jgi:hypothetical protein
MIIEPYAPEREELAKGDLAGSATLKPYLARGVMSMHRGLEGPNPVDPDVRGDLYASAVDSYA